VAGVVTENHGVGGSIPPLGTKEIKDLCQIWAFDRNVRDNARDNNQRNSAGAALSRLALAQPRHLSHSVPRSDAR
jgi:hypothetical protein